jgi:hypothetical protein
MTGSTLLACRVFSSYEAVLAAAKQQGSDLFSILVAATV